MRRRVLSRKDFDGIDLIRLLAKLEGLDSLMIKVTVDSEEYYHVIAVLGVHGNYATLPTSIKVSHSAHLV